MVDNKYLSSLNERKIWLFAIYEMKDLQMHCVALGLKVYERSRLPDLLYLISSINKKNNFVAASCADGTEVQKYIVELSIALQLENQRWLE